MRYYPHFTAEEIKASRVKQQRQKLSSHSPTSAYSTSSPKTGSEITIAFK